MKPIDEELALLLRVLPAWVQDAVTQEGAEGIEEIVMDLGRPLALRYPDGHRIIDREVSKDDIHHVVHRVHGFREDNRTGIDRTVHRISCIRDRYGQIIGLTIRIGRSVEGAAEFIRDLILSGENLLFVGPPGSGKTTLLRDSARILSSKLGPKVVIVDTSNEIGGDGKIPHPGIGRARRIQVPEPSVQAKVLMQAIANHGPAAIVIDEIGFHGDVEAVITIARRGVQMLATAHGHTLEDIVENPDLAPLLGGVIVRGGERARAAPPVFGVLLEVVDRDRVVVHRAVAKSVDAFLRGGWVREGVLPPVDEVELRVRATARPEIRPRALRALASDQMFRSLIEELKGGGGHVH